MKKTDDLIPYEKNPRMNDSAVTSLCESIKSYGFKVPIVIDKNNIIVCGHTRLKAAKMLAIDEVPCIVADDLTDEQIRAFRIADNKVSDLSIWDNKLLLEELCDLDGLDLFTGFEFGDVSDYSLIDYGDKDPITGLETNSMYEITIRSRSKEKLEEIQKIWREMGGEDETQNFDC